MSRIGTNLVANFAGRISTMILGVAFVPVYLKVLGLEGYGLIGIFAVLQSILSLFDFGLGTALTRQLARDARDPARASEMRDFTRTVEWGYWGIAIALGLIWAALSPVIATHWLQPKGLEPRDAIVAVMLMGVAAAIQFPFAMYGGGLQGLQRQVSYNGLLIGGGWLRSVGAVLVLRYVGPTVVTFFAWQVISSTVQSGLGAVALWRALPAATRRARFDTSTLTSVWRFAAGTGGTTLLGAIRSQVDKVLLTKLLPLAQFGNYALAGVLGSSVYSLGIPFYIAYFPRLSEIHAENDEVKLARVYHEGCQLLSVVLLPAAAVASIFAGDVLTAWTGNPTVASGASMTASLLVIGFALAGLGGLPYTLQLACGWSKLAFQISLAALFLSVPLISLGAVRYGAMGTAAALLVVNGAYTVVMVERMHRHILMGERWRWYILDVGAPLVASIAVALVGRLLMPTLDGRLVVVAYVGVVSVLTVLAAVAVTPAPRRIVTGILRRFARTTTA